jgi:ribonuclease HIII
MIDSLSRKLDGLVLDYWLHGSGEPNLANQILDQALPTAPKNLIVAARCLQVIEVLMPDLPESLRRRETEYRARVERLARRWRQVDTIGDPNTPPAAIFEILGEDTAALAPSQFDSTTLANARTGARSRAEGARRLLETIGFQSDASATAHELLAACEEMIWRGQRYQAQGLFVNGPDRAILLGLQVEAIDAGEIRHFASADEKMQQQAKVALDRALEGRAARWDIEWPVHFEGTSIGLGVYVAGLTALGKLPPDPTLAATGHLDITGEVRWVDGIASKLAAATASGVRRVMLPEENRKEAEDALAHLGSAMPLQLLYVGHADEVRTRVLGATAGSQLGYEGWIRLVRYLVRQYGLSIEKEKRTPQYHRFSVADKGGQCLVDVYSNGRVYPNGPKGSAMETAQRLVAEHIEASKPAQRELLSYHIPAERRERLRDLITNLGIEELPPGEYESWRMRLTHGMSQASVILYSSGRCVVPSATAPAFDELVTQIEHALEGLGGHAKKPAPGTEVRPVNEPVGEGYDVNRPHIGTDEAGKGDFFGPLVSAAVYVDGSLAVQLRAIGVRDSKLMSDKTVRRVASEIQRIAGKQAAVTLISPRRYNELYSQMRGEGKNLNTLLAWGHARSIEDLLGSGVHADFAVVDQFADARYMQQRILADTRQSGLVILQFPKAETDIAVAAASVLARNAFLGWLEMTSRKIGTQLPKGASMAVIEVARQLVARSGRDVLKEYAKVHFKTMEAVLVK